MLKNNLSLVIIFTMLFISIMPLSTPAEVFSDINGTRWEEAVTTLSTFGLLEGKTEGLFAPNANLTRAEMAAIIARITGLGNTSSGTDIFEDVPKSHWAYGSITAAYNMGIVSGISETTFLPDENVTYAQVVKMFVCILGYKVQAESMGGYPAGYLAKAAQLGILKGTAESGSSISRGDMAIILYNSLEVPMFEKTTYGPGASEYSKSGNETLLSMYMRIFQLEGAITSNYFTSIEPAERGLGRREVAIGSTVLDAGETNAAELLGRRVKVYYNFPDGAETPVIILVKPRPTSTAITINAKHLISSDTTKTKLVYNEGNSAKSTEEAINPNAVLIYNGKVKVDWTRNDLVPEMGEVTLVKNSGASADVVIVRSYVNYVVNTKDTNKCIAYFKAGVNGVDSMIIDPLDTLIKSEFRDITGKEFTINDINEWDILSVEKSEDGNVIRVIKSSESVSGKVTEVSDDEVTVGGTNYTVSKGLPNGVLKAPEIDMQAKFLLDFMGNIAAVNTSAGSAYKYGYLVGVGNTEGLDAHGLFKIFTEDGEMRVFDSADRVKVNGLYCKSSDVINKIPLRTLYETVVKPYSSGTPMQIYGPSGTTVKQLIKYKTNTDDTKVTEILTAENRTANPDDYAGAEGFNMIFELDKNRRALTPYSDGQKAIMESNIYSFVGNTVSSFASRFLIRPTTKVFVVPPEGSADEKYKIKPASTVSHGDTGEIYSYMSLYDLGVDYVTGAMVWDQSMSSTKEMLVKYATGYETPIAVVTGISKGISEDGEETYIIKLYNWVGNELVCQAEKDLKCGYKLCNTDLNKDPYAIDFQFGENGMPVPRKDQSRAKINISELEVGDLIQYEVNSIDNSLTMAVVLFRAKTPGMYESCIIDDKFWGNSKNSIYEGGVLVSNGTVKSVHSQSIITQTNLTNLNGERGPSVIRALPVVGKMIVMDMEKGTFKPITTDQIVPNDKYLAIWRTTTQMMFIVYR